MISEKPLNINNDNNNRKEIEGPHFINEWITEEDLEHDKYETTESNKISDDSSISSPQIPPLSPPTPLRTTQVYNCLFYFIFFIYIFIYFYLLTY